MDLFQKSLAEAIDKNLAETAKWEKYLLEMQQAEANLRDFQKKLQVECMVPIGTKALMPGYLYHTSEILVGNGSKIFSKCTTFDALKICKHRQKLAEDRLTELEREKDLHKNKLELPFMENAFSRQGQEIIEEFDEEKERKWLENHKKSVAAQKLEERKLRDKEEKGEKSHEEVMNLLEELELMDELEEELAKMDIQTDEQLQKLISGEIQPPKEKKRVSHGAVVVDGSVLPEEKSPNFPQIEEMRPVQPIIVPEIIVPEVESPPDEGNFTGESSTDSDDTDIDATTVSEQVYAKWKEMLEASKNLKRMDKKIYLKQKMKDVQKSLQELIVHDVDTLTIRIDLNDLKDLIEDELIRMVESKVETEVVEEIPSTSKKTEKRKKSRISFATEDDVKLIDKHEAPCKVAETEEKSPVNELTRQIRFQHSEWPAMEPCKEEGDHEIASPMDVYSPKFGYFPLEVKEKHLEGSPSVSKDSSCEDLKSILKNKEKVLQETHRELPQEEEKETKKQKKVKKVSEATDLLGEVVERTVDYEPKKQANESSTARVSKFKANRNKKKS